MKNILLLLYIHLATSLAAMEFNTPDTNPTKQPLIQLQLLLEEYEKSIIQLDEPNTEHVPLSLHDASRRGNVDAIRHLIKCRVNVNTHEPVLKGKKGNVPLCLALYNIEIMELLLEAGADVNAITFYENPELDISDTLLMRAASLGNESAVRILLKYGANPLTINKWDETIFDIVQKRLARKDQVTGYQKETYVTSCITILNLCNAYLHNYKDMYKQLLLIQRATSSSSSLQVIPRDMLNHIMWILTGLLCSQVQNFKP